ncbi:cytochrome P450 [Gigaspora margarita]|uniref:Cytochrome P450 n=1 Tax=Gigaspora margarita TaxID=4874 RepID=A0A8H4A589_GIGMA|nr:cytochrome P450 [Gigaspora margarita]
MVNSFNRCPIPLPIIGSIHIIGVNPYNWYIINAEKAVNKPNTKFFERFHIPAFGKFGLLGVVFNNDYNSWYRNRFVAPALSSPKFLRGFIISVQNLFKESENKWSLIIKNLSNGIEFDFRAWMKCFTTDITLL